MTTIVSCSETKRNQSLHPAQDLKDGGVYDCTIYGAWGHFLLANSLFPPRVKRYKTLPTHPETRCYVLELQ